MSASGPDTQFMRLALRLARRGLGQTSPNPMVGAVLVRGGEIIGQGWHRRAGGPHAEIAALADAKRRGNRVRGATLYVTLEPCSTHGRTPPCTDAIIAADLRRVVVGATDPNPHHAGRGFKLLQKAGLTVEPGILAEECTALNEVFNHWILRRTPFVAVKAAMTLDGKIATASGESKWITGPQARAEGQRLRRASDGIVVGINTILADDPSLTVRPVIQGKRWQRIILDSAARTPLTAQVVTDEWAAQTLIVVGPQAPARRVSALKKRVPICVAPLKDGQLDLGWLLHRLGQDNLTSLLVEGGGEVNASFLLGGWAQRVAFFYAPKILGGRLARKAVAGAGAKSLAESLKLREVSWRRLGEDLYLRARIEGT